MHGSDHTFPAPSQFDLLLVTASFEGSGLGDWEVFLVGVSSFVIWSSNNGSCFQIFEEVMGFFTVLGDWREKDVKMFVYIVMVYF